MSNIPVFKVFVAGDGGVGKSTMVERFVKGIFIENMIITIGVNHFVQDMQTKAKTDIKLQIWDLGGEDRFSFIVKTYVRGAGAGFVVFDTTRYSSYKNLGIRWLPGIRDELPDVPLILIGTKKDLEGANTDPESYKHLMEEFNIKQIIFTSSKTGEKISESFQILANIYDQY